MKVTPMKIPHAEDINRIPQIVLPKKLLHRIRQSWTNSLIVRLLGKSIGYRLLCTKVKNLWALQDEFNAIDLGCSYFLFKFSSQEDCAYVYSGGPWVILDHYLTVRKWKPDFKASEAFETTTAVWVRFPELPIEYFQEKVLYTIAKQLGRPLKIDLTTAMATRGKFARVCIEMDLNKPLCPRFLLGKKTYAIEYESIHSICFHCGRVDHRKELCRHKAATRTHHVVPTSSTPPAGDGLAVTGTSQPTSIPSNDNLQHLEKEETHFGPWMIVTRRNRRSTPQRKPQFNGPQSTPNRFAELDSIEAQPNILVHVNKESASPTASTSNGPQIATDPQLINAIIKPTSHNIGPAHPQEHPSPHAPTVSHVQSPVGLAATNTTSTSHMETSSTLPSEKPSLKESFSVSPEIPMEDLQVDISISSSRNPLTSYRNSSLRVAKSRARKPLDPPHRHEERERSPTDSVHSQDG
ncbi:Uncharacterized protein LOK49_LG02G01142 [Camellia lanceoleosa]|uniref:Uncharacterized protein n=1 Tax=Camellia lanceoleosa TaxID=1840588 RepID=A0ACC0IQL2_9ERIC|nr:Uncharacterized protein LOK49_LG02G01142 [Camellia lanceoleosa]